MTITKDCGVEIIIVTSHRLYDTLGGVEKFVGSFSSWCCKNGISVKTVSRTLSLKASRVTKGPVVSKTSGGLLTVKKIQLAPHLYYFGLGVFSLSAFFSTMRLIKESRLNGPRTIVIHSQDINFAAIAAVLAGKLLSVSIVLHQHGPYQLLLRTKSMKILELCINKITCRYSDLIMATDIYTADYLQKIVSSNQKIKIIPAGIETRLYEIQKKSASNSNCFAIGYIGRFALEKNVATLIRAFKQFKLAINARCKLVLVGDGKLRDELKSLARFLKIEDCVEFAGFQTDIQPYLSTIAVFVLPSKIEGTPISLLEAMATGRAIIASDIPPITSIVTDGDDALLFNPFDATDLTAKLLALFRDSELRCKLGANAKSKSKQYDVDVVFSKIIEEYRMLIS